MITKQSLRTCVIDSSVLLLAFFIDVLLFTCAESTITQISLCLCIVNAWQSAPLLTLIGNTLSLCILSLLYFGSIETYALVAMLVVAFARFFKILLHQRFSSIIATTIGTFVATYILLACTTYTKPLLYTIEQFFANLVIVLVLFIIFEKVRDTR